MRLPLALKQVAPEERFRQAELSLLGLADLGHLLTARLGRPFARRMVTRIKDATGGNPFSAIEVARSLPENAPAVVAVLPMPERLLQLGGARILGLPRGRVRRFWRPPVCRSSPLSW